MNQPTFVETINNIYTRVSKIFLSIFLFTERGEEGIHAIHLLASFFGFLAKEELEPITLIRSMIQYPSLKKSEELVSEREKGEDICLEKVELRRVLHVASNITRLYGILKASRSARRESSSCSSERITRVARQTSLHDSLIVYDIIFNNERRRYLEGEIIRYTLEKEIIQKSKGFEIRGFSTRRKRRERISKSFGSDLRARRWILKRLRRSR